MEVLGHKKAICVRAIFVAGALLAGLFAATIARADLTTNVFVTQQDFANWTPDGNFLYQTVSSPDFDGSSTNGIGNTTNPGGAGTPGSLGIEWVASSFATEISPDETANTALITAMGTGGYFKYQFSTPDNEGGTYFALGLRLNTTNNGDNFLFWYNNGPGVPPNFPTGSVANEGSSDVTAYARYAFNPVGLTYLQLGFVYNSNYNPVNPFYLDAIQIVRPLGDFNFDGQVDAQDIAAMQSALTDPAAYDALHGLVPANLVGLGDFNGDGKFTNADLQGFLNYLKNGQGSTSAVPEPASLVLFGLAIPALAAAAYRRRKSSTIRR